MCVCPANPKTSSLLRYLQTQPPPAAVLELGAGLGVAGLTCHLQGCPKVVLTEQDLPELISLLEASAKLNTSASIPPPSVLPLPWSSTAPLPPELEQASFPLLLAADVLYTPQNLWADLISTATKLASDGARLVLAQKHRETGGEGRGERVGKFIDMCGGAGWAVEGEVDGSWCEDVDVVVFELRHKI
jgi:predicted nicotinamide N-methyase